MIWFSFGRWNHKADSLFTYARVYRNGWQWTPFVMISKRYGR
jgi:hypothetical protein